jgi:hypothetical protein
MGGYVRMDLRKIWCGGADWNYLNQDRDQWQALNMVMNLWVT